MRSIEVRAWHNAPSKNSIVKNGIREDRPCQTGTVKRRRREVCVREVSVNTTRMGHFRASQRSSFGVRAL
jgi:hypothetical protein